MTLGIAASSSIRKVSVSEVAGRRQFREENRGPQTQRHGNQQRQHRGDHCAVNKRERPELLGDGVPQGGNQETQAELIASGTGTEPELQDCQRGRDENQGRKPEDAPDGRLCRPSGFGAGLPGCPGP